MKYLSNQEIAAILRKVAIAYEIVGESSFRVLAYQQAADSIENLTEHISMYWKRGQLQKIPGVGGSIAQHLDELLNKGRSQHFKHIIDKMPVGMFELLKIRSIGPKTAYKLSLLLNKKKYNKKRSIYQRLKDAAKQHDIAKLKGFSKRREEELYQAVIEFEKGLRKKKRMALYEADMLAANIKSYLLKCSFAKKIYFVGSLRRRKETVGDIDVFVITQNSKKVIDYFLHYPEVKKVVDKGIKGTTILLKNNVQVDMRIIDKKRTGSMLQYFTGSKYHNVHLREYALSKKYSLSEWGIKDIKRNKMYTFEDEKNFYSFIGMHYIPPEVREDRGEIDVYQIKNKTFPKLVEIKDIKGDLHIHTDVEYPSSHDKGTSSIEELLKTVDSLSYEYVGFSDHNPKAYGLSRKQIKHIIERRTRKIEQINYSKYSSIKKVYNMYEVDIKPDGSIAFPSGFLSMVDAIIVSIHSSFRQTSSEMTKRILKALSYPKVKIFAHPTARLINKREPILFDWDRVFAFLKKRNIALEINANPVRLDASDTVVFEAIKRKVKLIINTDAHHKSQLSFMQYGIDVARRGWAQKYDILNTRPYDIFNKWIMREVSI